MKRSTACLVLLLALGAGESGAPAAPPAVLDGLFPEGRRSVALEALAPRAALDPGENLRIVEIGRDTATSHHLVAIRDREQPHRHERHDLLVVMLKGHGFLRLGDQERPVGRGSILYLPRGTPHAFRNASREPALAYAVARWLPVRGAGLHVAAEPAGSSHRLSLPGRARCSGQSPHRLRLPPPALPARGVDADPGAGARGPGLRAGPAPGTGSAGHDLGHIHGPRDPA